MPMIDNQLLNDFKEETLDLCPYHCGYEDCEPGHFYGPAVRDHYLFHFVLDGKGFFQIGERVYNLSKGQGFLICPDIVTYYKADDKNPWIYTWIGFQGFHAESYLKRANLSLDNPIFTSKNTDALAEILRLMVETNYTAKAGDTRLTGLLYLFVSQLIEDADMSLNASQERNRDSYIRKALSYVNRNYSNDMTVEEMARHTGINRKYLSLVFKESLGHSPKEYLTRFRIKQACQLLKNPALSISEVSWSVGYNDPLLFSKMFKKIKGICPREYRKQS